MANRPRGSCFGQRIDQSALDPRGHLRLLRESESVLYMDRDRTEKGFAVVQSQYCEFERISKFLLWVVYDPEYGTADHYREEWEELAIKTGHDAVEFVTPIDAIGRLTRRHGYRKVSSLYRKDL